MDTEKFKKYNTCYNCEIDKNSLNRTYCYGKCSFDKCNKNKFHIHHLCKTCYVNILKYLSRINFIFI